MGSSPTFGQVGRLLGLVSSPGDWNMAVDEALLAHAATGPPTLRLFAWSAPWLSLGCLQSVADVDLDACRTAGVAVVRRASGGTAVLHEHALGYSAVLPAGHPLAVPDIMESYRLLAAPARLALDRLGVRSSSVPTADAQRGRPTGLGSAACFTAHSPYELVAGPRKIVGHSQIRRRGAVLYHAVLLLHFSPARFAGLLKTQSPDEAAALTELLGERIGSLTGELGRTISAAVVAEAIRSGFEQALGLRLAPGEISPAERQTARGLLAEKYANPAWTLRR